MQINDGKESTRKTCGQANTKNLKMAGKRAFNIDSFAA